MWILRRGPNRPSYTFGRNSIFVYRDFQVRYIRFLLGAIWVALLFINLPVYYFLQQNYAIFSGLAYQNSPELLQHLDREQMWLNGFLLASMVGVTLFCFLFGLRITHRIAYPLARLEQHMRMLSRGYWHIPEVENDERSEFFHLVDTYNYFYKSLRQNNQRQLELLARIHISENDRDSQSIVRELVSIKSQQLGEVTDHVLSEMPSPDQTRVS